MAGFSRHAQAFEAAINAPPDFKIKIGEHQWFVHSAVLAPQSKFFERACSGNWNESLCGFIELHDDCPYTIALMISCLYCEDRTDIFWEPSTHQTVMDRVTKMMYKPHAVSESDWDETVHAFNQRSEIHNICLLFHVVSKYDIPQLVTVTKQALQTQLADQPTLATEMAKFFGTFLFSNDEQWCQILMDAWYHDMPASTIHAHVLEIFEYDPAVSRAATTYLFKKLEKSQGHIKQLVGAVENALGGLEEADLHVKRQRNEPLKNKFKEIRNELELATILE